MNLRCIKCDDEAKYIFNGNSVCFDHTPRKFKEREKCVKCGKPLDFKPWHNSPPQQPIYNSEIGWAHRKCIHEANERTLYEL